MPSDDIEIFYPESQDDWRSWLERFHEVKSSVWIKFYNKKSNCPSLTWSKSVDIALCYGWIDSKKSK